MKHQLLQLATNVARLLYYVSSFMHLLTEARITAAGLRHTTTRDAEIRRAIAAILQFSSDDASIFSIGENNLEYFSSPRGVAMYQVNSQNVSTRQTCFTWVTAEVKSLRQTSENVLIVAESDDPVFLTTLLTDLLNEGILVWSVRLLVITELPLIQLQLLHGVLSQTNSLLIIIDDNSLHIRFKNKPTLRVAVEQFSLFRVVTLEDKTLPAAQRIKADGYMILVLDYVAHGLNFSYTFTRPHDRTWGMKKGTSVTGMVGQVYKEEADIGLGPFGMHESRAEVVDFTWPLTIEYATIIAGLGIPEIHPWAFLFPFRSEVWAAVLIISSVVPSLQTIFSKVFGNKETNFLRYLFDFFGVALRETLRLEKVVSSWWHQVLLGAWILTTMVLTMSYEGNLMSLIAVRHIRQPFNKMSDILQDKSVSMVWQSDGIYWQYVMDGEAVLFRNIKEAEESGRVEFLKLGDFSFAMDAETRCGRKVIVAPDTVVRGLISQHFTVSGECAFYILREELLPTPLSLITKKNSPLIHGLNTRIISMNEAGLYDYWYKRAIPNITFCLSPKTKISVSQAFSLRTTMAMFVIFAGGHTLSFIVFCFESLKLYL